MAHIHSTYASSQLTPQKSNTCAALTACIWYTVYCTRLQMIFLQCIGMKKLSQIGALYVVQCRDRDWKRTAPYYRIRSRILRSDALLSRQIHRFATRLAHFLRGAVCWQNMLSTVRLGSAFPERRDQKYWEAIV